MGVVFHAKDVIMHTLAPDEKATTVMIYTVNSLVRGDLITKQSSRVSIWLRMQGQVHYIHLHKPQVLALGGALTKSVVYDELHFPIAQILGFHPAAHSDEPLDYDPDEPNRIMKSMELLLGGFLVKGKLRISTHADFATAVEVAHSGWLSVYDAEVTPMFVQGFPIMHAPLMLVNPMLVGFGF